MKLFKKTDWSADNVNTFLVEPHRAFKQYKYITIKYTVTGKREFITTPSNGEYLTYLPDGLGRVLLDWKKGVISNQELENYMCNFAITENNDKFTIIHDYYDEVDNISNQIIKCLKKFNMIDYKDTISDLIKQAGE